MLFLHNIEIRELICRNTTYLSTPVFKPFASDDETFLIVIFNQSTLISVNFMENLILDIYKEIFQKYFEYINSRF